MQIMQSEIEGEKIFSYDMYGQRILIGRTENAYKALNEAAEKATKKAEQYFDELVMAGLREKEKTQEEINADLNKKLEQVLKELNDLRRENNESERTEKGSTKNRN